jgi:sugar lactone lactonase YvrE
MHRTTGQLALLFMLGATAAGAAAPPFPGALPDYRAWVMAELPGAPEGLTADADGRLYASIPKLGAVVRLDEHGGHELIATVPSAELARAGRVFGLEADRHGGLYVTYVWNYSEEDEADPAHTHCRDARDRYTGIYRVDIASGRVTPLLTRASGWPGCFPDDVAVDAHGNLYVTDLTLSGIWKIAPDGHYVLWSTHPLLQWPPAPYHVLPEGANDLVLDARGQNLYVATDGDPAIVRIPIAADGSAGTPVEVARDLSPLDGIELDELGNIYVSEILRNEISVYSPDGRQRIVIATADTAPLVGPTSLVYRRGMLCVANMGWDVTPEPRTVTCVSGFRRPGTPAIANAPP